MLFCIALSTLTGVVFGLVPALRATRPDLTGALKDERVSSGDRGGFGLRNLLVVAQVTICMVLLICSCLFLRSLYSARNIDPGFAHRNVLMLAFDPSLNRYSPRRDAARRGCDPRKCSRHPGRGIGQPRQQRPAQYGRHPEFVCAGG